MSKAEKEVDKMIAESKALAQQELDKEVPNYCKICGYEIGETADICGECECEDDGY